MSVTTQNCFCIYLCHAFLWNQAHDHICSSYRDIYNTVYIIMCVELLSAANSQSHRIFAAVLTVGKASHSERCHQTSEIPAWWDGWPWRGCCCRNGWLGLIEQPGRTTWQTPGAQYHSNGAMALWPCWLLWREVYQQHDLCCRKTKGHLWCKFLFQWFMRHKLTRWLWLMADSNLLFLFLIGGLRWSSFIQRHCCRNNL